ncbi:MAG: matrixin family metalloprotease [bacterium]
MKKGLLLLCCLIGLCPLFFPTHSHALMRRTTLSSLIHKARHICYGQIVDFSSEWDANRTSISTTVKLSVLENLKETAPVSLSFTVPGGCVGEVVQRTSNSPCFWQNERVVVFVDAGLRLVGGFQGKFHVNDSFVIERGLPIARFLAEIRGVQSGTQRGDFSPRPVEEAGIDSYTYGYSVSPYHWCQENPMGEEFYINAETTESQRSACLGAADTWNLSGACFQFMYGGISQTSGTAYDGTNIIYYDNNLDEQTLAQTTYWYNTSSGCMLEADCAFNDRISWSVSGDGADYDIQTCMLHEFGHYLSLDHSKNLDAIMYPYYSGVRRSLAEDDRAGIMAIYGRCNTAGEPTWNSTYQLTIGKSAENLALLREYRDQVLIRNPNGKYQIKCLYSQSKELLQILSSNPQFIVQAQRLIEKNLPEIQKAVNRQQAVLQDQDAVYAFLDGLASSSRSPKMKIWLNGLKRELSRCQQIGKKFYGFKVGRESLRGKVRGRTAPVSSPKTGDAG